MINDIMLLWRRGLVSMDTAIEQVKQVCEMFCDKRMPKEEREALAEFIRLADSVIGKKDRNWWEWDRDVLNMFYISPVVYSAI